MGGDEKFVLDFSWLPASGWALKGRVPGPTAAAADDTPQAVVKAAEDRGWQFRWGIDDPEALKRAGTILAVGGGITSALGAFVGASEARAQSDSAALAFEFESRLSGQAARSAELEAQGVLAASKMDIGRLTLAFGQQRAERRAETGASGIRLGRGSSARVAASEELRARIDEATIRENAAYTAGAARGEAARRYGESLLAAVSARNARRSAKLNDPFIAAATSILSSFGAFGAQVASDKTRSTR